MLHLLSGAAPLRSLAGAADVALLLFGLILAVLGTRDALSSHAAGLLAGSPLPRGARRSIESLANPGLAQQLGRWLVPSYRERAEVVFPLHLSKEARREVHVLAQKHRLMHHSEGEGARSASLW